ncbi:Lrp/AsnC family transcriptional regulator [Paraburkholderia unamae]|uniref:AsnC family transcriptional regulator n=1 Tax=Paraburkholderia unamae TaxID=219649 RepID=A0ABX5KYL0_9BURK|nr:Lrp/AsnC family transcriptional regulator [Paraburkholderia unamae]PVX85922.1 AsnC family transcriptional regulator [Paraburkholderia unamae]
METRKLDATDRRILSVLQRNAKLTNVELAEAISLSPSPCLARVKALERDKVISRYIAVLNPESVGLNVNVFIRVRLEKQSREILSAFEAAIMAHEEVLDCYLMSGEADYLLRVAVPDVASLERLTIDRLSRIPGVASIQSSFALKEVKANSSLPLG